MRLVVTGREGQLARALRARAGAGVEIVVLARPQIDLARPAELAAQLRAARPDALVNAAAFTDVDLAETQEALATRVNGEAAGELARACAGLGAPMIQISTDYVFDGTKPAPYAESDPPCPLNAYGRSKLAGERAVAAAGGRSAILRTSWVFAGEGRNFLTTMLRLAAERESLDVVDDQIGAPTFADDLADVVLALAARLRADADAPGGLFHATAGGQTSWAGFAAAIFALSAQAGGPAARVRPVGSAQFPRPARRPANSRLDCSRLEAMHGLRLPDWRDGLSRCMQARCDRRGAGGDRGR